MSDAPREGNMAYPIKLTHEPTVAITGEYHNWLVERANQLAAAEAECAALRRDAGRYRWLRDADEDRADTLIADFNEDEHGVWYSERGAKLDAAIDAALGADKGAGRD
jgi:hypothetical protein